jgi:hypothetical protein
LTMLGFWSASSVCLTWVGGQVTGSRLESRKLSRYIYIYIWKIIGWVITANWKISY